MADNSAYKLIVVGKRCGFKTGEREINVGSSVIFSGFVSDDELVHLYSKASAFIFPSLYEGFGLPLLEAMNFNLPIAASDIPVFHEIGESKISFFDPVNFKGFDCFLKKISDSGISTDYSEIIDKYCWVDSAKKIMRELI